MQHRTLVASPGVSCLASPPTHLDIILHATRHPGTYLVLSTVLQDLVVSSVPSIGT